VDYFPLQVLLGKFSGAVSALVKEKCWADLASAVSAVSGIERSAAELKKKWSCLKSEAKSTASQTRRQLQQTGGGPEIRLISLKTDRIVSIIGDVCVEGVDGGVDTAACCQLQDTSGMMLLIS